MQKLEEFDPLPINNIQFNLKHVKKYTSIITILISIGIFVLTFIISFNSIRQIWAPLKDLTIHYSAQKHPLIPFTDLPLCLCTDLGSVLNSTAFSAKMEDSVLVKKQIPIIQDISTFPQMFEKVKNMAYQCYNLKGFSFENKQNQIYFQTNPNITLYGYMEMLQVGTILNEQPSNIIDFVVQGKSETSYFSISQTLLYVQMEVITFQDRLLMNYQPRELSGMKVQEGFFVPSFHPSVTPQQNKIYLKSSTELIDNANVSHYTIIRKNIGEIISQILAWQSLILIPLAIIFFFLPFAENFLKVDLIKARYTSPELDNLEFSIWRDIKRRFNCIFKSRVNYVLNKAIEKIDDELDLMQILRKMMFMRKSIDEVKLLENSNGIFDCDVEYETDNNLLLADAKLATVYAIEGTEKESFDFQDDEPEGSVKEKTKQFIKFFDETQTNVAVTVNGGKGYGSLWNLGAVFLMSAGLASGLLLLGILNVKDNVVKKTITPSEDNDYQLPIYKNRLLFRPYFESFFSPITNFAFNVTIIDQNGNIVREVNTKNGSDCQVDLQFAGKNWYCLENDQIIINKQGKQNRLSIQMASQTDFIDNLFASYGQVELVIQEHKVQNESIVKVYETIVNSIGSRQFQMNLIKKDTLLNGEQFMGMQRMMKEDRIGKGFVFTKIIHNKVIEEEPVSYWEVLDNGWGLVILTFELIIFRISRLINIKVKNNRVNEEKQQQRSDILSILNDIDLLAKGAYHEQLCSVKHYFKIRADKHSIDPKLG